jgi:hypothetical protein
MSALPGALPDALPGVLPDALPGSIIGRGPRQSEMT